jgi:1,4-alpha-glucan branching enzyme
MSTPLRPTDFVLGLHSHLPWVLNHGRWPHGSDWLSEAAIDAYLPLIGALGRLERDGIPAPLTLGITPVLASQFASPDFGPELEAYFAQRLATCAEAAASLATTGDTHLLPLAEFWRQRLTGLHELFHRLDGDLVAAFADLADSGRIELISSAATHGFLPLLSRDESIRLQLVAGRSEHTRLFGRPPAGLWLPECAYRPAGPWAPLPEAGRPRERAGLETFVAEAGYRYCFVDSHMAGAGRSVSHYDEAAAPPAGESSPNTPYRTYRVGEVAVLARDPLASRQVWSRQGGYPGDEWYLEFHKIRWPGGLKYWRVSAPGSDLGAKLPYDPARAQARAAEHARHFARLLAEIAVEPRTEASAGRRVADLIAVPFDTELFGHWWFEGVDFLAAAYRELAGRAAVRPRTASEHLARHPPSRTIELASGSWGADGDFSMWLNPETRWTWPRLWALEAAFWRLAPAAVRTAALHPVLAQAAREMLLAQASDWQFIMTTGQVRDYAVKRFTGHCDDAEFLLAAIEGGPSRLGYATARAGELWRRDHCFPDILDAVAKVLG